MRLEKAPMPEQWARTIHRLYQIVVGGVVSSSRYLGGAGGRAARGNSSAAEFSARCRVVL
jgi:hypothetical protein